MNVEFYGRYFMNGSNRFLELDELADQSQFYETMIKKEEKKNIVQVTTFIFYEHNEKSDRRAFAKEFRII